MRKRALLCDFVSYLYSFARYNIYAVRAEADSYGGVAVLIIPVFLAELCHTAPLSELGGLARKVFLYHKSYLERNGVIEFAKIKTGKLSDFFKAVNEGVSVNEELS